MLFCFDADVSFGFLRLRLVWFGSVWFGLALSRYLRFSCSVVASERSFWGCVGTSHVRKPEANMSAPVMPSQTTPVRDDDRPDGQTPSS